MVSFGRRTKRYEPVPRIEEECYSVLAVPVSGNARDALQCAPCTDAKHGAVLSTFRTDTQRIFFHAAFSPPSFIDPGS
jgi:hypothetical protein